MEWLRGLDATTGADWIVTRSASAAGQAGAAFITTLIGIAVVGMMVFVVNAVAFIAAARRSHWPSGHAKWAWLLAIPAAFALSVAIPGFYVWAGLLVPAGYWFVVRGFAADDVLP